MQISHFMPSHPSLISAPGKEAGPMLPSVVNCPHNSLMEFVNLIYVLFTYYKISWVQNYRIIERSLHKYFGHKSVRKKYVEMNCINMNNV